jgi:hypothetical protein
MTVRPPLDIEAASRLAKQIRLVDVVCTEVSGRCLMAAPAVPQSGLSWDLHDPTAVWAMDEDGLRALFPLVLTIEAQPASKSSKAQPVAEFHVSYMLLYAAKDLSDEQLEDVPHYVGVSGFLHFWPYLRAEIQCLSAKLRLPPLVLPTIVSGHAADRVSVSSAKKAKKTAKTPALRPRRKATKKPRT